jgi:hypothetical protein
MFNLRLKSKKGDITDMLVFIVTVTILAIGLFIFAFVIPQIANGLSTANMNSTPEGTNAIAEMNSWGVVGMQRGFFLLFVALIISLMITSVFSDVHPMFLFLYLLVLGISIVLAVYLGNMYDQISQIPTFAATLGTQSLINSVMHNIVLIILAVGALTMIITFSKFSSILGGGRL